MKTINSDLNWGSSTSKLTLFRLFELNFFKNDLIWTSLNTKLVKRTLFTPFHTEKGQNRPNSRLFKLKTVKKQPYLKFFQLKMIKNDLIWISLKSKPSKTTFSEALQAKNRKNDFFWACLIPKLVKTTLFEVFRTQNCWKWPDLNFAELKNVKNTQKDGQTIVRILFEARWTQVVIKSLIFVFCNSKLSKMTLFWALSSLSWPYLRLFGLKPYLNKQFLKTTLFRPFRTQNGQKRRHLRLFEMKNDQRRPQLNSFDV